MLNHTLFEPFATSVGWCYCLWQMEKPLQGDISMWQMLLPRVLFQFEFWGVEQNLIPYVRQMELAYIFVKGWIIDLYVQCFFDSSAEVLVLPTNNIEIFNGDLMTSDVTMVMYWWGGLLMFFKPLPQMILRIHQYILHHSQPCHTCIYRRPHSFSV